MAQLINHQEVVNYFRGETDKVLIERIYKIQEFLKNELILLVLRLRHLQSQPSGLLRY